MKKSKLSSSEIDRVLKGVRSGQKRRKHTVQHFQVVSPLRGYGN